MALEFTERAERTERAGIPVHWAPLPGPFSAALAFRVGIADERLSERGITHLIEHVTLSALGRREHAWNGCVDESTTMFHAEGERDEVLEFLRLVGDALSDLPEDRIDVERRVLRAEAERHDPGVIARLADHRFGSAGFGLTNYGELGLRWLQPGDLRRWCIANFTRGNAVVWMTGEPPEDLGLTFRDGPRLPRPTPEPLDAELPAYVAEGRGGVALSGLGERSVALRVAMHIAGERLYDTVRGERGLAYAPAGGYLELDARLGHAFLGSDCPDEHAPAVLDALWRTVRELAADGATDEELDRYRRRAARALDDPERTRGRLGVEALGELVGDPARSDAELTQELEALDGAAVAVAMDQVARSAIVLGPEGCPSSDRALRPLEPRPAEPLTEGEEFTAFSTRTRFTRRAHVGATLRVSERGVTWETEASEPSTILWDRCEAVVQLLSGGTVLHQRDGAWMEIPTTGWDAETPFERLKELVPVDRKVPVCDRALFDRILRVAAPWLEPGDGVYGLLDRLPGMLGGEEELLGLVTAVQRSTAGLLVATDRRVLWLTYEQDTSFEIPTAVIANVYTVVNELLLYWEGHETKLVVVPGGAADPMAAMIRGSRTEPDR